MKSIIEYIKAYCLVGRSLQDQLTSLLMLQDYLSVLTNRVKEQMVLEETELMFNDPEYRKTYMEIRERDRWGGGDPIREAGYRNAIKRLQTETPPTEPPPKIILNEHLTPYNTQF